MVDLELAIHEIIGKVPRIVRPPHLLLDDRVATIMARLDYAVIQIEFDTLDWDDATPEKQKTILDRWKDGFSQGVRLILAHDTHPHTADVLLPRMISSIRDAGLKGKYHE
jgi:peptidoglycan/xylan/chitin deacetylase (PgdA/CDA1 family)